MLYLDAAALVMRYVPHAGRDWLEKKLKGEHLLYSSAISYAETHAALARRFREGDLKQQDFHQARNRFEVDWLAVQEVAVDHETLQPVTQLVAQAPLRGMDAIHLAAAVWLQRTLAREVAFVTSDKQLLRAAKRFGFPVFDPAAEEAVDAE